MNNEQIGLGTEPKYTLKVHSAHAKSRTLRCFKGRQMPFLGESLVLP